MNIEKKLIPLLRFPEFEKDGMWGEKCFGDCLDYEQPQQYLVSSDNYKKEGTPVLTAGKTFVLGFTDESYGIYRQLPVIIFDDFTTASRYVNFPFKAKSSAMKMLQNKDGYDLKFMFEALQNYKYEPKEHQRHWISIFQNFKTLVPSYSEQQKIAECLSSIDSYIYTVNEKVEQLKAHKKSLLQKLFPQGGKTVPDYRFPEFEKDGAWEEKELGELIVEIAEFTSRGNNVPLYSLTIEDGVSPKTDRYERNFLVKKEGDNFKVVYPDDFVSNPMNLRFGAIGYNKESFKVCISGYYDVFRFKDKGTSSFWISYMKSDWALDMYDRIATGSLYEKRRVHFSSLLRTKLLVPKYSERLKISEYLSSMEEVISLNSKKASLLEQHKKGIMQQLFHKS